MNSVAKSTLFFYGGTGSVTGANFLLECETDTDKTRILVDCGLEQGSALCTEENYKDFPYDPKTIDVLFVTHAHLDHIGRIPKLVRDGFDGIIYSTPSTKEIVSIMLEDSAHILKKEATKLGRDPIYEEKDISKSLSLWQIAPYHKEIVLPGDIRCRFKDAGHILGSAMLELSRGDRKIVFTGDLGNTPAPLLRKTEEITGANYLVMESVYGDRNHQSVEERSTLLKANIKKVIGRKGVLMIPAFSIERTQVLLHELNGLVEGGEIPAVPVYLDSPLAIKVTEVYRNRHINFNEEIQKDIKKGDDIFAFPNLHFTKDREESKKIYNVPAPKIIIAGSGMSHGGRIIYHERAYIDDPKNMILLVGYQAAGSPGRRIQEGDREIDLFGEKVRLRAEVVTIEGYSAHKDSDGLVDFVSDSSQTLEKVFVVMGETKSSTFLAQRLREYLGVTAIAPEKNSSEMLSF